MTLARKSVLIISKRPRFAKDSQETSEQRSEHYAQGTLTLKMHRNACPYPKKHTYLKTF